MKEMRLKESPLVNNKKLRQLYTAMVEARALDDYITAVQRKVKDGSALISTRGQEACRVSTAIELLPGDLVSEAQLGVGMDLLAGAKPGWLLRRISALHSGEKRHKTSLNLQAQGRRQLPWMMDRCDRLRTAIGAAMALKTLLLPNIVVAYVPWAEASGGIWRRMLLHASSDDLPIIFVILPPVTNKKNDSAGVSAKASIHGVPRIPVDANDAVALYRVAQESIGRARGEGGPILIECVGHHPSMGGKGEREDPIQQMRTFLLRRRVCDEAWLDKVGGKFQGRMKALARTRGSERFERVRA